MTDMGNEGMATDNLMSVDNTTVPDAGMMSDSMTLPSAPSYSPQPDTSSGTEDMGTAESAPSDDNDPNAT
jgi:hypothetical protein